MSTKSVRTAKKSMTIRLAAASAVIVAGLVTAAPAMANYSPEPGSGGPVDTAPPPATSTSDSVDLSSAGVGALAGIALGGAGLGIALAVQHRRDRSVEHPA